MIIAYRGMVRAAGRKYPTAEIRALRRSWGLPHSYFSHHRGYDIRVQCPPAGWMAVLLKGGAVRLKFYGRSAEEVEAEARVTIDRVLEEKWTS